MLIIEHKMVNKLQTRSPISFNHVFFWCPFLDPNYSNIHIYLKRVTELGMCTLQLEGHKLYEV